MADYPPERGRWDDVLGVGASGRIVADLTPRLPIGLALDLGTGCGLLGLLASRHAARVFVTDVNPRALAAAELNAQRNGVDNLELRHGDLFEPVADARFDLIMANPPYVVSPDAHFLYRDGDLREGGICARIVRALPRHLQPGGFAVVQAQWPLRHGENWWAAPKRWTDGAGLDLWLIGHGWAAPGAYARAWLSEGTGKVVAAERDVQRWRAWYAQQAIRAIMTGVLILRRRPGGNWRRAVQALRKPEGSCSRQLVRIFEAQDWLLSPKSKQELLHCPLRLAEGCRLEASSQTGGTVIEAGPDIGWSGTVADETMSLLLRLDGRRTLAEIAAASDRQGSRAPVSTAAQGNIRQLFGAGFLELGS